MKIFLITWLFFLNSWGYAQMSSPENEIPRAALFLNQPIYSPGDTIFFKAFLTTASLKRLKGHQTLTAALVNQHGASMTAMRFGLKDGTGNSQMIIPNDLSSGYYLLTLFKETFNTEGIGNVDLYRQEIEIVKENQLAPVKVSTDASVKFYFEGGNFITGPSNKVIVNAKAMKSSAGTLIDQNEKSITPVIIDENGVGTFIFKPEQSTQYILQIYNQKFKLPDPITDGVSMLVTIKPDLSPMRILVTAPDLSSYRSKELTINVSSHQQIYSSTNFTLDAQNFAQFLIPQKDLPEGVSRIDILDKENNMLSQRKVYINRPASLKALLSVDQKEYANRQLVTVNLSVTDSTGNPVEGEFAMTVLNSDLFPEKSENTFEQNLSISGDLPSDLIIDKSKSSWFASLDKFLITETQRADSSTKQNQTISTLDKAIKVSGSLYFKDSKKPIPDQSVVTIYLQKYKMGYEANVLKGKVQFDLLDFPGSDEIFYDAKYFNEQLNGIEFKIDSLRSEFTSAKKSMTSEQKSNYGSYTLDQKKVMRSYSYLSSNNKSKATNPENPNEDWEEELQGADVTTLLEKYVVFPTMEDVIREVTPSLMIQKEKGKQIVRVYFAAPLPKATGDPIYIVDGLMTHSTEFFLSINPADVWAIKIIKDPDKLSKLGQIGRNGVVFVQSKRGIQSLVRANNHFIPIEGLTRSSGPRFMNYSKKNNTERPNFRAMLYWNPSIKTNKDGTSQISFYTSDDVGPFVIKIAGLTIDGQPFSTSTRFEVKFSPVSYQKQ